MVFSYFWVSWAINFLSDFDSLFFFSLYIPHKGARVAQSVMSLDPTTHTSLSPIRRGLAPGYVH
jgi:hypothetical protein